MHDPTESDDEPTDRPWPLLGELRDWRDEIHASAIFLTRLPIRWSGEMPPDLAARSLRAGPVVGAAIGLIAGALFVLLAWIGVPALAAALIAVASQMLLTGALHEDGLADLADGLGGGDSRDSKVGHALIVLIAATLALAGLGLLVGRQIGGYTGDVLGAAQQCVEIAVLVALAALA